MKIHGAVYLLVGLITTVISAILPNFGVFIVVGVIFMAIGIGKFILSGKPKDNQQVHYRQARSNQTNNQNQRQVPQGTQQQASREQYEQYQQFLAFQRMQNQQGRQK